MRDRLKHLTTGVAIYGAGDAVIGVNPASDKLSDTVQLLQMRHAHAVPGLRTTRTVDAIRAAAEADLVTAADAESLIEAWRFVSRIRNAGFLVRGKPVSSLDELANERAGVASLMGYPESEPLMDDYRRITRHARQVVERLFY